MAGLRIRIAVPGIASAGFLRMLERDRSQDASPEFAEQEFRRASQVGFAALDRHIPCGRELFQDEFGDVGARNG